MNKLQTEIICLDFMKRVYEAHRENSVKENKVHSIYGVETTETVIELVNRYTRNIVELEKRMNELKQAVSNESRILVM